MSDTDLETDWPPTPPVARVEYSRPGVLGCGNLVLVEASPDGGGERRTFTVAGYACQEHAAEHARRLNEALCWTWKVAP